MLDNETRESIRYLALIKQKEQLEKEIEEFKKENKAQQLGLKSSSQMNQLADYFKD